jgi:DNA invertase Pin-like site-specific DNA recombinase
LTIKIKTAAQIEQIGKLRRERFSYRLIAERFGVAVSTVRDICKKNGFEPNNFADHLLQGTSDS